PADPPPKRASPSSPSPFGREGLGRSAPATRPPSVRYVTRRHRYCPARSPVAICRPHVPDQRRTHETTASRRRSAARGRVRSPARRRRPGPTRPAAAAGERARPGARRGARHRCAGHDPRDHRPLRRDRDDRHAVQAMGITGKGMGIAILDSGIDGLYNPDLVYPTHTVQNIKVIFNLSDVVTFKGPAPKPLKQGLDIFAENLPNSETSVGHGTHVAGITAALGTASAGYYKGVAP